VNLHGQPVVLTNVDRTIDGLSGMCSHTDGPLGLGKLRGGIVECPFHGGQFEVRK
jgi:nitrite reductase/ring-hydroxylating ferredoxin subunit